jgi:hypothetical protein
MKFAKYIFIFAIMASMVQVSFGQTNRELDRFSNESLEVRNQVKIYPNPSTEFLDVRINNSTLKNASFTVHNIIGNVVDTEVEHVGENQFRIRVKDLAPGYYLLAIKDDGNLFKETYKFLKR